MYYVGLLGCLRLSVAALFSSSVVVFVTDLRRACHIYWVHVLLQHGIAPYFHLQELISIVVTEVWAIRFMPTHSPSSYIRHIDSVVFRICNMRLYWYPSILVPLAITLVNRLHYHFLGSMKYKKWVVFTGMACRCRKCFWCYLFPAHASSGKWLISSDIICSKQIFHTLWAVNQVGTRWNDANDILLTWYPLIVSWLYFFDWMNFSYMNILIIPSLMSSKNICRSSWYHTVLEMISHHL